jgi:DNA-binding response OmpR family regulator
VKGYNVFATSKGDTAISISQKTAGEIDLLITDAQIDSINGFQLAQEILQQKPTTKIMMMSKVPVLENAAVHRGFGFLRKPYSAVALKRRVREVLASGNPASLSTEAYPNVG